MGTTITLIGLLVSKLLLNSFIKSKRVSINMSSVNEKNIVDSLLAFSAPNQLVDKIKAWLFL